jgi:hypothetical protein
MTFAQNRDALHRIAEEVISPARVQATGNQIAPWTKPEPAPEWNAVGFTGAEAPWNGETQALAFFRDRRDALCRPSTAS